MNPDHFAKDSWAYLGELKINPRCLSSWQCLPAGPAALWGHFKASALPSWLSLLVLQAVCLITGHGIRDVISSAKAALHLIKYQPPVSSVSCRMICVEAVTLQPWVQRKQRGSKMCLKQLCRSSPLLLRCTWAARRARCPSGASAQRSVLETLHVPNKMILKDID